MWCLYILAPASRSRAFFARACEHARMCCLGRGLQGTVDSVENMKHVIRYNGYPNEKERFDRTARAQTCIHGWHTSAALSRMIFPSLRSTSAPKRHATFTCIIHADTFLHSHTFFSSLCLQQWRPIPNYCVALRPQPARSATHGGGGRQDSRC